jgi:hypothetical protein
MKFGCIRFIKSVLLCSFLYELFVHAENPSIVILFPTKNAVIADNIDVEVQARVSRVTSSPDSIVSVQVTVDGMNGGIFDLPSEVFVNAWSNYTFTLPKLSSGPHVVRLSLIVNELEVSQHVVSFSADSIEEDSRRRSSRSLPSKTDVHGYKQGSPAESSSLQQSHSSSSLPPSATRLSVPAPASDHWVRITSPKSCSTISSADFTVDVETSFEDHGTLLNCRLYSKRNVLRGMC